MSESAKPKNVTPVIEFNKVVPTDSRMVGMKGSTGLSFFISMPFKTPFGLQESSSVKNLTNEEAIKLRDFLNANYPIPSDDIVDVNFSDGEMLSEQRWFYDYFQK